MILWYGMLVIVFTFEVWSTAGNNILAKLPKGLSPGAKRMSTRRSDEPAAKNFISSSVVSECTV